MSALPQRKKTTEELSQLRDGLGIRQNPAGGAAQHPAGTAHHAAPAQSQMAQTYSPPPPPKPVRSLRKSERDPAPRKRQQPNAHPYSSIPGRRHSGDELRELQRREALARLGLQAPPPPFRPPAPLWLTTPGYLLALSVYACLYWTEIPLPVTAGLAVVASLVAAYILLCRPLSRHHAAFIGITTLFAVFFAALHYFPYLRHAS